MIGLEMLALWLDDMPDVEIVEVSEDTSYVDVRFNTSNSQSLMIGGETQLLIELAQTIFTTLMLHEERIRSDQRVTHTRAGTDSE